MTPQSPVAALPTESETVIDRQLQRTKRHVKGVDIATGLLVLTIGVLAYLLAAAVVDHWMVAGGLGFWGRLGLWLVLSTAAGGYFALKLLPPLRHRINPIFAAAAIEQSQPTLKNSLINFLLLRPRREEVAVPIYRAMERRAADDLANVELDVAIDRTRIVHLLCVLAGVVALFGLYQIASPKNPLRSAARVLWPWASVDAPTRVAIHEIEPGSTTAFYGDTLTVSAEIAGLRDDEAALLVYRSADGQTVDQTIPLTQAPGEYRYQCHFPPGSLGLQQSYDYQLAAGDCRTRFYRIDVQVAPAITVEKVAYDYPAYTGIADRTAERQGDIRAVEGTEITIQAAANTEIKPNSAVIDLDCTGQHGRPMTIDGRTATGRFTLRTDPKNPAQAEYDSYQIRFNDLQGRANQRPIRHRIEVVRDMPPRVELVEPNQPETSLAVNDRQPITVRAVDPDFGLQKVVLRAKIKERDLPIPPLLQTKSTERATVGEFSKTFVFEPASHGLKPGDRVEYWAEADDNKTPAVGHAASATQFLTIIDPNRRPTKDDHQAATPEGDKTPSSPQTNEDKPQEGGEANANKQPQDDQQPGASDSDQKDDKGESERKGESKRSDQGQGAGNSPQAGKEGEKSPRIDPEAAPGDAMQEILKDRQQEQSERPPSDQQKTDDEQNRKAPDQKTADRQQSENSQEPKPSEGDASSKQPSETQGDDGQSPATKQDGQEKAGGEKSPAKEQKGNKEENQQSGGKNGKGPTGQGATDRPSDEQGNEPPESDDSSAAPSKTGESAPSKRPGENATDGQKPERKSGNKSDGTDEKTSADAAPADQRETGESQSPEKDAAGDGQDSGSDASPPGTQGKNAAGEKAASKTSDSPNGQKPDEAQSPTRSDKQSQGDTAGDQSGGGEQGGGQQADQRGAGAQGSQTATDDLGPTAKEQGDDRAGTRAGRQATSETPRGSSQDQNADGGRDGESPDDTPKDPGGQADRGKGKPAGPNGKTPQDAANARPETQNPSDGRGMPSDKSPSGGSPSVQSADQKDGQQSDQRAGGGQSGHAQGNAAPETSDSGPDEPNLDYARRQTALALEHLRDQLAKEKPALLDRLGWTKEDARQFLDRWERMRAAAAQEGPDGQTARRDFDDALKSLGLRPRGAELRYGGISPDQPDSLHDAGRHAPPPDWAEQFGEYTRGIAGGQRKDK